MHLIARQHQLHAQRLATVRVVFDNQYSTNRSQTCNACKRWLIGSSRLRAWQANHERAAFGCSGTVGFDAPTMQFDQMTHQRQANAQSALCTVQAALTLREKVKDSRQQVRTNADPVIGDTQYGFLAFNPSLHANQAAGRCVFNRVRKKIVDDLAETVRIAVDPG